MGSDVPVALNIGSEVSLEALPITADSTVIGTAVAASWQSSDTVVATITTQGVLRAICVGNTLVTAATDLGGQYLVGARAVAVATTGPACAAP
jgi:hypothetical protein